MDINPIFNSRAVYKFNEVHVNESKALHLINYQLISRSKTAIVRARGISTGKISLSYTVNEDECVDLLRLSFSFIRGSLRVCDAQLLIRSDACCISAVISD